MKKNLPGWLRYSLDLWAGAGLALIFLVGVRYWMWPGFIDHAGEITMTSVAWLLYEGHPLYTAMDAAERYSLQHGPLVYLLIGGFLKLFGPGFHSGKLVELLCLFSSLGLSWYWFKQNVGARTAFWLTGLEAWLLSKWYYLYLSRSDSMMLLLVLAALAGVTMARRRWSAVLGVAVSMGLLASCKVHEILWSLPVLLLLWRQQGGRAVVYAAALIAAVALAPFALPGISLIHYGQWLQGSVTHGISRAIALGNLSMLLLLFAFPAAASWGFLKEPGRFWRQREQGFLLAAVLAAAVPIAVVGSKAGSGSHHLAPLVPFLMFFLLQIIRKVREEGLLTERDAVAVPGRARWGYALVALLCIAVLLGGINGQGRILKYREFYSMDREMVAEFYELKNRYRGQTLMIGYGENDRHKWYNQLIPLLVFDGNPYLLDIAALNDMGAEGMPLPVATLQAMRDGVTRVWLLPAGHQPFRISNAYVDKPMFSPEFRDLFMRHYRLVQSTRYFDVWAYRAGQE